MKINRSTKLSLKFCNDKKLRTLDTILTEYGCAVNFFINEFWEVLPKKSELLKTIVDLPTTWLSARLRKVAAREAIDMINASKERWKEKAVKPMHRGERMCVSSTVASLQLSKKTSEFDAFLHLSSIGDRIILDLPVRFHDHFHKWNNAGKRLESYVITRKYVQLCFETETGPKKEIKKVIGVDTGINALASTSDGQQFGSDIKKCIERIKRCKHGSKGQKRSVNALRQRMCEVAKEVVQETDLVVVENLKGISNNTKRRGLGRKTRYFIGRWNQRFWLSRLQMTCEQMNVSFRSVSPRNTSRRCSSCGHVDERNRLLEVFRCRSCDHTDNADINAARNILDRFLTGPYGAGCKACHV